MKPSFRIRKVVLLLTLGVFSFTGLFAQDTCELFSPSGLKTFHEEHIDMSKGVAISAADSLHFFFKDESLAVLETFSAWGKANNYSTKIQENAIKRETMLHFIKITTVLDDLSFKQFTDIVDKVMAKKKELNIDDCGAMGVGHPTPK
jgi:hypothetical protein